MRQPILTSSWVLATALAVASNSTALFELEQFGIGLHLVAIEKLNGHSADSDHHDHDGVVHHDHAPSNRTEHAHRHRHSPNEPEHEHPHADVAVMTSVSLMPVLFVEFGAIHLNASAKERLLLSNDRMPSAVTLSDSFRPPIFSA